MQRLAVLALLLAGCRFNFTDRSTAADGMEGGSDASPDAGVPPNLMFVTSTQIDFCAVGVAGADAECAARATAAALPGSYRAWVSQPSVVHAKDRFAGAAGWVRRDGRPFADSIAEIIAGRLYFPPRLDENGNDLGLAYVITGTNEDGTANSGTGCMLGGLSSHIGYRWDSSVVLASGHVACLGVDRDAPITPPQASGRIAFVTTGRFDPATRRSAADTLCANEAAANQLPGTYLAFLSTATEAGSARFDLNGSPWVTTDGLPIMASAADLATWTFTTGIDRHADKTLERFTAWSGHYVATSLDSTCMDWTSSSAAVNGVKVDPTESSTRHYTNGSGCAATLPVLCFQL